MIEFSFDNSNGIVKKCMQHLNYFLVHMQHLIDQVMQYEYMVDSSWNNEKQSNIIFCRRN